MSMNGKDKNKSVQEKYKYEVTQEIGATGTINKIKSQKAEKK